MRDIYSWRRALTSQFRQWPPDASLDAGAMCDVELALCAAQVLAPSEGASSVPALLSGYPFALGADGTPGWSKEQRQAWSTARVLLPLFKNSVQWERALENYRALHESLRAYTVEEDGAIVAKPVGVCAQRHKAYGDVLRRPVPHTSRRVQWAGEGEHLFLARGHYESVSIPPELVLEPPPAHPFSARAKRKPLRINWDDLEATALWMDAEEERSSVPGKERGDWQRRFKRLRLESPAEPGDSSEAGLARVETLDIDGRANFIGMVSSGKSTLMDVVAVWAARNGLRITLVVGDVISVLNRAQMFTRLGLSAAPILGASNRKAHIERMHRTLAGSDAALDPGAQFEHGGFRWLSTVCPLDGLRSENNMGNAPQPLPLGKLPCTELEARGDHEDEEEDEEEPRPPRRSEKKACPIYGGCPTHQAQRDLVGAAIWIATPASLVYSSVARPLNSERVRFLEMACRRSDLVIVDEADQVQVQLDNIFNPSQTLVGPGGWLDWLHERVAEQLNTQRRAPLAQENVGVWTQGHGTAQVAVNCIYHLIQQNEDLRHWIEENNYFTSLTLFDHLAQVLEGASSVSPEAEGSLRAQFEAYVANPLGEEGDNELCVLSHFILANTQGLQVRKRLRAWIEANKAPGVALSGGEANRQAARLELALLVAVLQNRVDHLRIHWSTVEGPLKLEGSAPLLSHLPPEDYRALLPEPPMGQVLAFQYVRGEGQSAGDLRFFRCMGVGRWALLHLHELFAGDGVAGPNVLLLSGTSWAGSSPSYHLQAPVNGILRAPDEEVQAIEKSLFEFLPQHDREHRPIHISGRQGSERMNALRALLRELAQKGQFTGSSVLEGERNKLPQGQQRVLLVVNSYEEAESAYKYLTEILRLDWQGHVRYLVPDDKNFENEWHGGDSAEGHLRRGAVGELAQTGAWLLIAPLLAVERGHNILASQGDAPRDAPDGQDHKKPGGKAAIGAAFFLVRPHQRPDDIGFAVHSINHWAIQRYDDCSWLHEATGKDAQDSLRWSELGEAFREAAEKRWRELLRLRMQYSTLPETEREAVLWSQIVSMWQVIGRLVRGGSPARVFFCDAAFAPATASAQEGGDRVATSLLVGMREVLRPYFTASSTLPASERALVQALYGPFYAALANVRNLPGMVGTASTRDDRDMDMDIDADHDD